jgi:hypothetical protein
MHTLQIQVQLINTPLKVRHVNVKKRADQEQIPEELHTSQPQSIEDS